MSIKYKFFSDWLWLCYIQQLSIVGVSVAPFNRLLQLRCIKVTCSGEISDRKLRSVFFGDTCTHIIWFIVSHQTGWMSSAGDNTNKSSQRITTIQSIVIPTHVASEWLQSWPHVGTSSYAFSEQCVQFSSHREHKFGWQILFHPIWFDPVALWKTENVNVYTCVTSR